MGGMISPHKGIRLYVNGQMDILGRLLKAVEQALVASAKSETALVSTTLPSFQM